MTVHDPGSGPPGPTDDRRSPGFTEDARAVLAVVVAAVIAVAIRTARRVQRADST